MHSTDSPPVPAMSISERLSISDQCLNISTASVRHMKLLNTARMMGANAMNVWADPRFTAGIDVNVFVTVSQVHSIGMLLCFLAC